MGKTILYLSITCDLVIFFDGGNVSLITLKTTPKEGRVKTVITIPGIPLAASNRSVEFEGAYR